MVIKQMFYCHYHRSLNINRVYLGKKDCWYMCEP